MPALSFSCENKKKALINKKCCQTIRPRRKNEIEVGDRLYNYWKQRVSPERKTHHKLGEGLTTLSEPLKFVNNDSGISILTHLEEMPVTIARKDGFDGLTDFYEWFVNRYGDELFNKHFKIIRWDWVGEEK